MGKAINQGEESLQTKSNITPQTNSPPTAHQPKLLPNWQELSIYYCYDLSLLLPWCVLRACYPLSCVTIV